MSDKSELRHLLRLRRQTFVKCHFFENDVSLFGHNSLLKIARGAKCLGGYVPMDSEANLMPSLEMLVCDGVPIALPCLEDQDAMMTFRRWIKGDNLIKQKQRFLQPLVDSEAAIPDVILLPLIGFDRAMNRLGQGAGHYDRLLATLPDAILIGIAWSVQEVEAIPIDPWDIPLDAVATEKELIVGANSRIRS